MALGPESRLVRNSGVLQVSLSDDTVVLLGTDGLKYFALGDTGSRIWKELELPVSLAALVKTLTGEFDVDDATCMAETRTFIEALLSQGFASVVGGDGER
jgi:Coenzyme PQQ synthesis protein D (PqqD)